jgi:uncharacterized membrane protein
MLMTRWLTWIVAGLLLGGIVHLGSVLILPRAATQDAYSRLLPMTETNKVTLLPLPTPETAPVPFMDPAFASAVCRYDLAGGPLRLQAPISQSYTSVSFYSRQGAAYYAINDRAAGRRIIELELMTPQQRGQVPDDEEVTAADRLIVESPSATGLIVLRTLALEPGQMPRMRGLLSAAQCGAAQVAQQR